MITLTGSCPRIKFVCTCTIVQSGRLTDRLTITLYIFELHSSTESRRLSTGAGKEGATTVPQQQAWYKPLPGGGAAIFVANHGNAPADVNIDFAKVPGLGPPAPPAHCVRPLLDIYSL